ncbi:PEP-CTERM/exosortase system-associated acyltransferase [Echinimonas agarilytica]|uniref:PEP-CTERM/exosortase system-associated acyltransferase n=1 Tax=Echinimonas agarilytica TaxID=1215918 RepID=A0AA41WAI4_9GAMM|nr:PEP-CTERM/exosortase system-associated acyltransferase [Echinimonas agarilytica]MCM2681511.1 PEP-CTERM/exosortase system-associated acyltransferase [Echinimonas agarilytica]
MNKKLKRYAAMPIIGPLVNIAIKVMINREGTRIAKHFSEFLLPQVAYRKDTVSAVYRIRHQVYCEELEFEAPRDDAKESDEFDKYSRYCLMQHRSSKDYAGTVRVVAPQEEDELLPIEKYCAHAFEGADLKPSDFARKDICEISRLAVPAQFRRRNTDRFKGAATGAINETSYSAEELRCFPFLAIGLYLAAGSLAIHSEHKHAFVMMEPRLARSMAFIGVKFRQLGPAIEYHGKRAPYYINAEMLHRSLPDGFKKLYAVIDKHIEKDGREARLSVKLDSDDVDARQVRLFK